MVESLQELQAKLDRLVLAREHHGMEPATKNEFTKLIRSTRAKINRLEKKKPIIYAAGYEEEPGSFGMFYGPVLDLLEVLHVVPHGIRPCIIRFNKDGSDEVLYRWDDIEKSWKIQGRSIA
jgi:hypothetical protein